MSPVTPYQFSFFRIVFSSYLFVHFSALIPWGSEMFSNAGLLPDGKMNPTSSIFPNMLYALDTPFFVQIFLVGLCLLSLLLLAGYKRRLVALLLWYGWACLFNRNIFTGNPGLPFIGWILLALTLIPPGEPLSRSEEDPQWEFPKEIYWGAWLLLALGYTASGLHKLGSPSWVDGTAIQNVLENPLARDTFLRGLLLDHDGINRFLTWSSLALEILFLPLALISKTRPFAWLGIVGMHLGIITTIDFADLTSGVLIVHLFTFDSRWIKQPKREPSTSPILFFDGVCGLCNGFIDFLLKEDRSKIYKVSPLQGDVAKTTIDRSHIDNLDSLVLVQDGLEMTKSTAVLRIFRDLGSIWWVLSIFRIFPAPMRDAAYDFIASHRYRLFGKKDSCRLPTPEERSQFLD
ncbi:MAG: DUF393 domain-containing protein [Pseudobdellovibrionaceae bacterium]|nr:DUF393 domain-containing protein [Bdellovibrionales bacterium]USN47088.1 MAG: DUF393 domain-containing protein [Pseudobdellovibrionaceae bacterium]